MNRSITLIVLLAPFLWLQSCQPLQAERELETVTSVLEIDPRAPDRDMCASLKLSNRDIETYFSKASEVDENEFNAEALILPCKYKGTIKIRGQLLQWEIYAGGAGYLYDGKSVNKRYLCKKDCCGVLRHLC